MVGHAGMLLREQVRHAGVELHAGGEGDGAEGIVRRDLHIVGLGHSRDLARLKYAAAVAEVGLDDGDGLLLDKLTEAELREETLTGGDGYRCAARHTHHFVHIFGQHRLLDEERIIRLERLEQADGHRGTHAAVEVDRDIDLLADALTHRGEALNDLVDHFHVVDGPDRRDDGIFHNGEAVGETLVRYLQHVGYREVAGVAGRLEVAVHAHLVAVSAAEHFKDRHVIVLALDVPERHFDAGDGGAEDGAAAVEGAAVHTLPEVLYLQRVCADEHGSELIDGGLDSSCAAFNDRFAPAAYPLVGFYLEEHPARTDMYHLQVSYFHCKLPLRVLQSRCSYGQRGGYL